jgi:hypothetical protein
MRLRVPTRPLEAALRATVVGLLFAGGIVAQVAPAAQVRADWRRIGTITIAEGLASPSSGVSVDRVAFLSDGRLQVALTGGRIWQTSDGEIWTRAESMPAPERAAGAVRLPEANVVLR